MNTVEMIAAATGLGFLAGMRLYATVLALGLAVRFELIELSPEFAQLEVLARWEVIGLAAFGYLMEFVADKVPWVDSLWDTVHTFVRPIGAAALGANALGAVDPSAQVALGLLTGSVALTSHSAKAATRLLVNHSPEPFSNVALSLAGDIVVPFSVWATMEYPLVVGGIAAFFVGVILLVSPYLFRFIRLQMAAFGAVFRAFVSDSPPVESPDLEHAATPLNKLRLLQTHFRQHSEPPPAHFAAYLRDDCGIAEAPFAIRAVPGRGVRGLRNSIGYLCFSGAEAVFVTRRWFRIREHRFTVTPLTHVTMRRGILFDELIFEDPDFEFRFDLFKDSREPVAGYVELMRTAAAE